VIRGTAGLKGKFGDGFEWRIDASGAESKLVLTENGWINVPGLRQAINTGAYNFVDPSQNNAAVAPAAFADHT